MGFRTDATEAKYQQILDSGTLQQHCALCDREPLQAFTYWKIIENHFPYDKVTSLHEMIVPYRHVTEDQLTDAEKKEFAEIKRGYINDHYDYLMESAGVKSIPVHHHIHLVVAK